MHILIGLVVATVLVIGWACGNLFACVFLSLGALGLALAFSSVPAAGNIWLICFAIIFVIWVPFTIRHGARS